MSSEQILAMIIGIIGGLGIFLLGMKNMSDGLQAIAGERLRRVISAVTNNRLMACGVGTFVTAVIQSSSITTVMTVGMVNAGLMTLKQAIGVIYGANIGTTMTAWILTIDVGKYGLLFLGLAAFPFLFSRRDKVRYTAMMVLGLGMVFFGLELMKNGFSPLKDSPTFVAWFHKFQPTDYFGVWKCVLVGAALTAVIQSSSATVGITMGLASTGLITYETAVALVLGENIGTTITAWLAALGAQQTTAKRAAYAHVMFNTLGVVWITAIFHKVFIPLLNVIVRYDPNTMVIVDGVHKYPYINEGIALAHTTFNVANVFVFLWLLGPLARLLERLVPGRAVQETPHLQYIEMGMLSTPLIGIAQSMKEVAYMGQGTEKMMGRLRSVVFNPKEDEENEQKIFDREESMDVIQKEVIEFLSKLLSGNVPHEVMDSGRKQLRMADEYETISDYVTSLLKLNIKWRKSGQAVTDEGRTEITDLHDKVAEYLLFVNNAVRNEDETILARARSRGDEITHLVKEYRSRHLRRVETGHAAPLKSLIFTDMLAAYRRIKDHALNIAEVICGEK